MCSITSEDTPQNINQLFCMSMKCFGRHLRLKKELIFHLLIEDLTCLCMSSNKVSKWIQFRSLRYFLKVTSLSLRLTLHESNWKAMKTSRLEKWSILSCASNTLITVSFAYYLHWPKTNKTRKRNKKIIILQIILMMGKPTLQSWSISTSTHNLDEEYNGEEVIRMRKKGGGGIGCF